MLAPPALSGMELLYPTSDLSLRVSASRTDGYWPYISRKEEPPKDFTYGEFPIKFFEEVTTRATHLITPPLAHGTDRSGATFLDLGSGAGRLVLAAAAMDSPWKLCRGVELLGSLHALAEVKLAAGRAMPGFLQSEVLLEHTGWDAPTLDLSTVDVAFAYTTCIAQHEGVLTGLTAALSDKLRAGCIVVTTDYQLGVGFEQLEIIEGENLGVGDTSTAYLARKL
mmetsp:Transcript_55306/g.130781  ORF Transcript_55306/g.130781 Transcript_55306/m.130781 type:complete len:224 (-) Transcript_55306:66-737(-)